MLSSASLSSYLTLITFQKFCKLLNLNHVIKCKTL